MRDKDKPGNSKQSPSLSQKLAGFWRDGVKTAQQVEKSPSFQVAKKIATEIARAEYDFLSRQTQPHAKAH